MNNIDYNLGILKRLVAGSINGRPYVMLDDVEFIIKNGGVIENKKEKETSITDNIRNVLDCKSASWPDYYDECNAQDYHEWFIKGTNIKVGFDYIDGETKEHNWYRIITESYDDMILYDSEEDFLKDIKWMLMNNNLTWRYYE